MTDNITKEVDMELLYKSPQLKRPGLHDARWCSLSNCDFGTKEGECLVRSCKKMNSHKVVLTCIVIFLGVCFEIYYPPPFLEDIIYRQFNTTLVNLQDHFPRQTDYFWRVCLAAIKPVLLQKKPKHPGVVLLAGSKNSQETVTCLAKILSEAVKDAFEADVEFTVSPVVVFDSSQYKDRKADEVKRELNEKFTKSFQNGSRVGVILGVESLPGNSPMIFYRLCDTASAPFKKVVIILTLNMEEEAKQEVDRVVHDELMRLWKPVLDEDQVEPLFSRIGNSVAFVREDFNNSHCAVYE